MVALHLSLRRDAAAGLQRALRIHKGRTAGRLADRRRDAGGRSRAARRTRLRDGAALRDDRRAQSLGIQC